MYAGSASGREALGEVCHAKASMLRNQKQLEITKVLDHSQKMSQRSNASAEGMRRLSGLCSDPGQTSYLEFLR